MSIVYILINEAMPGLIKIGRTSTSVQQRIAELNHPSGIPLPFTCYYAAKVSDSVLVEKKLHEAFGDVRLREKREFFRLSPNRAQAALELAAIEDVTPREEIIDEFPIDAERGLIKESNRKVPSFKQYGIPLGAVLNLTKDENISAVVDGDRTVLFKGESMSMSGAALKALRSLGYNWKSAHGAAYWEYEGETIWDRWEKIRENW
jgi:rhodanese-related sulfurtransferase